MKIYLELRDVKNGMNSIHKISLSLILVISFSCSLMGQEFEDTRKRGKHFIGIKAGQNLSWLNLDPSVQQNPVRGPLAGISYNFMSQHFGGILVDLQYIEYGWEESFPDTTNSYNRQMSYLELPVMSNLVIGKKNLHLKFLGGFKVAYLLEEVENSDLIDPLLQYYNGMEIDDKFELGLAFGLGLSYVLPVGELQIDTRYNLGLSNIFNPAEDLALLYSQNQGISLAVYYWLKIK